MAFMSFNGNSMNGGNSRPLVLYISVHSPAEHSNDGRQKVYENLHIANAFPQLEIRLVRINGDSIFDDIMTLLLQQVSTDDFSRLQMVVVNGYAQVQTGTLGGESFTGAFLKVILLALLHRFPSHNNNFGHKIAVICAQCFSHMFVQQADSVPAKNPVFKFIPLTNSYMPYLLHTEDVPRMDWIKWDTRKFLEKLLVAPKLTCTSPGSPASPTITIMRQMKQIITEMLQFCEHFHILIPKTWTHRRTLALAENNSGIPLVCIDYRVKKSEIKGIGLLRDLPIQTPLFPTHADLFTCLERVSSY